MLDEREAGATRRRCFLHDPEAIDQSTTTFVLAEPWTRRTGRRKVAASGEWRGER
ncbi:hypothetical protein [Burkholderia sp. MSMB1589WGS]|uniref:hypothetical protein n=1 Tax=Burkholderia sp. MSMB1589WGS TaxID=1636425 RepID=UPI000B27388F|nr:hypothetical protein [Burkholderia sp. MSMB1589WGS]